MKNPQNNTIALPALLRTVSSVNTLETNSLCCEAAGIIAPSSATADALIPHEKLRGAALADATLNVQERPLAQPVVGYTPDSRHADYLTEASPGRMYLPVDITDTQLIDWLDQRGSLWCEFKTSEISFPHEEADTEGYSHIRAVLLEAYQQDQAKLAGGVV
ncbi:hypothetical protein [Pseudomonas sp. F8002]|uniref:hypothetical protein n=1 Tax=Pseudomonas sp. F8002 TaxID=2738822 RepID=UPI00210D05D6|nr:hypothetical protein [Pseudomonas sp. F8002]